MKDKINRPIPSDGKYVVGPYAVRENNFRPLLNYCDFSQQPICTDIEHTTAQLIDGTAGDATIHQYPNSPQLIFYPQGAGQAIDKPAAKATGMDYGFDQTDNDGIEIVSHLYNGGDSKGIEGITKFTVGKAAFYAKLRFSIASVDGTDDCAFGFCKVEDTTAIDSKDEVACLNVISGDIKTETILNSGSVATTDTTNDWADAEVHTLGIYVAKDGTVSYTIDGAAPTVIATTDFQFDTNEVVMVFFNMLQASAGQAGELILEELEYGLQ